ncbi:hypothetical protein HY504_03530 [Candidatus Wolfebacteria bacterium]|nr:hypothetical protein [Candidatus Wolfebacteria bacterium]
MATNVFSVIPRRVWLFAIFILVIIGGYFIVRFVIVEPRSAPREFLEARSGAAAIAADIVALSDQTSSRLGGVAKLDSEKKYTEALVMVSEELSRNRTARERAVDLSRQLEIMARSLSQISPQTASQKALEALSSETALISRLISYNDFLNQLLEILRSKFLDKGDGSNIPELIKRINNEAQAINDLNKKFNDAMKEFDSL